MYLLFAGAFYYPGEGFEDCVSAFPTLEEAQLAYEKLPRRKNDDWAHVARLDIIEGTLKLMGAFDFVNVWHVVNEDK